MIFMIPQVEIQQKSKKINLKDKQGSDFISLPCFRMSRQILNIFSCVL